MRNVHKACRSCGQVGLTPVLELGQMPLANRLLTDEQLHTAEAYYPLELALCPQCALAQITETVPDEEVLDQYVYWSSPSERLQRHARDLTAQIIAAKRLRPTSLVIEIASSDGYLLQNYQRAGIPVLGIEPTAGAAVLAQSERGVPTWCKFFSHRLAIDLAGCGQQADVVHAHNVLSNVVELNGFVSGLGLVLKDDGVAVIEVPYVKDLIDNVEFDTIYHEHVCYFSLTALHHLFSRHGLVVHDVERVAVHGGSLRLFVGKQGQSSSRVQKMLTEEKQWGVDRADFYLNFGQKVERLRHDLVSLLQRLKSEGRRIAVYGTSAKGSTLLNYFKIGRDMIDFVVDRNTLNQGRYTPGTHLKIFSPQKLVDDKPDYVLLLSWDFADEILAQQAAYRQSGGRFIIPIPNVQVA